MIDLKSLETFVWVARQQSFRAAAERLNTTQPAVSQRIVQLEDHLGVSLLQRTTRRVALTGKGRILFDHRRPRRWSKFAPVVVERHEF